MYYINNTSHNCMKHWLLANIINCLEWFIIQFVVEDVYVRSSVSGHGAACRPASAVASHAGGRGAAFRRIVADTLHRIFN